MQKKEKFLQFIKSHPIHNRATAILRLIPLRAGYIFSELNVWKDNHLISLFATIYGVHASISMSLCFVACSIFCFIH
jgi:hypothetical protein